MDARLPGAAHSVTAPQSVDVISPLPGLMRKKAGLERMLKQVNRDIEWLERKQSLAEFVAADRINSGRTDIPTLAEVVEWDVRFRKEYRRLHEDRNSAILASTTDESTGLPPAEAEDPRELLKADEKLQELDSAATNFAEAASRIRGDGFEAAEPLVGEREPRLSTLYPDGGIADADVLAWWAGAYQRIGLL